MHVNAVLACLHLTAACLEQNPLDPCQQHNRRVKPCLVQATSGAGTLEVLQVDVQSCGQDESHLSSLVLLCRLKMQPRTSVARPAQLWLLQRRCSRSLPQLWPSSCRGPSLRHTTCSLSRMLLRGQRQAQHSCHLKKMAKGQRRGLMMRILQRSDTSLNSNVHNQTVTHQKLITPCFSAGCAAAHYPVVWPGRAGYFW